MKCVALPAVFAALLMSATGVQAALYKCVENGQTRFSDKPCATKDESQAGRMDSKPVISIGSQNGANGPGRSSSSGGIPANAPLPGPIDFGVDTSERLARGMAMLQSILLDGQKCDDALKAAPGDLKTTVQCQNFLLQMRDGAQWPQTVELIKDLGKDTRFLEDNIEVFRQSRHVNDDINVLWKRAKLGMGDR